MIPLHQSLNLALVRPELILTATILGMLLIGTFRGNQVTRSFMMWGAGTLAVGIFLLASLVGMPTRGVALGGFFVMDPMIVFGKVLILGSSLLVMLMTSSHLQRHESQKFEYPILMLLSTLGMLLMVSCDDLMGLFMGLELQSLSLYVLAAFKREDSAASEASLKYFVLGAVSTCLILFGSSLLYGFCGTTRFEGIASVLSVQDPIPPYILFGGFMVVAGLAFKISAAPFHMWTPDVYEGTPTPVTLFLSAAPKMAAILVLARLSEELFGESWAISSVLMGLAMLSMTWGSLGALLQSNLKRLLAYSAIGHMGYALMGIIVGGDQGIQSLFIYMALYLVMTIGTFGVILMLQSRAIPEGPQFESIDDLKGLGKLYPGLSLALTLLMFSMAGIPPLGGFFGKLVVFQAALSQDFYALAIVGALTSVIGAVIYLKVIKALWFDVKDMSVQDGPQLLEGRMGLTGSVTLLMVIVLTLFTFYPRGLFDITAKLLS